MKCKTFLFLVFIMLFSASVSALEIDNIGDYNETTKTMTISNSILWIWENGKIAELELLPCNQWSTVELCRSPIGDDQIVGKFEARGFEDYKDIMGEIETIDLKDNGKKVSKEFEIKMMEYIDVEIADYDIQCETLLNTNYTNETYYESCNRILNGSHIEQKEIWTKLTPADLKKNENLTIGIFTSVEKGDHKDWIPTVAGVKIPQWSEWTADLNVGLDFYFKYEETSGTIVIDSTGTTNGTSTGVTLGQTGIILDAYGFDGSNDEINVAGAQINGTKMTISTWVKSANFDQYGTVVSQGSGGLFNFELLFDADASGNLLFFSNDGGSRISTGNISMLNAGQWNHIVATVSDTNAKIYVNGDEWVNGTVPLKNDVANDVSIGHRISSSTRNFGGDIDETAIWDRTLTPTEVTQLYNGGSGITWTDSFGSTPVVTLTSPDNDTTENSNSYSATFKAVVTDTDNTINNCSLSVWNVTGLQYTQTNTTVTNGTNVTFSQVLTPSNYTWNVECVSNISASGSGASNYTINIISVPNDAPVVTLNLPDNDTTVDSNSVTLDFKGLVTDDKETDNCTLNVWNVTGIQYSQTNTTVTNNTNVTFSQNVMASNYTWNIYCLDNESAVGSSANNFTLNIIPVEDAAPTVILNTPENNTQYTTSPIEVNFSCYASDNLKLENVSLYIDNVLDQTNSSGINNTNYTFSKTLNDGSYDWTCGAVDNVSQETKPTAYNLIVDGNFPFVNITAPEDGFVVTEYNESIYLNWTISDATLDTCWYTAWNKTFNNYAEISSNYFNYSTNQSGLSTVGDIYSQTGFPSGETFITDEAGVTSQGWSEILDTPSCYGQTFEDKPIISLTNNPGKYFCVKLSNNIITLNRIEVDEAISWTYLKENIVGCNDNTTVINYPTNNPDSETIILFANDSVGNIGTDSVTIYKSTVDPVVTITAPEEGFNVTVFNQTINLNWTAQTNGTLDSCFYRIGGLDLDNYVDLVSDYFNYSTNQSGLSTVGDIYSSISFPTGGRTIKNASGVTAQGWTDILQEPYCSVQDYSGKPTLLLEDNVGKYFCVLLSNGTKTLNRIEVGGDFSWEYWNDIETNCADNTTVINYPTNNPDNLSIYFMSNDTLGNIGYDNVIIFKNDTIPVINITAPGNFFSNLSLGQEIDLNFTVISNSTTLSTCFYDYNDTITVIPCSGESNFSYVLGQNDITVFVNDTLGNLGSDSVSWVVIVSGVSFNFTNNVLETFDDNFIMNITVAEGFNVKSADLVYNGTVYSPSLKSNLDGGVTQFNITITIPAGQEGFISENRTFFWNITVNNETTGLTVSFDSETTNQTVNELRFGACGGDLDVPMLNFTMFNEIDGTEINGALNATTFKATFNIGASSDSLLKNVSIENLSVAVNEFNFCTNNENNTIYADMFSEYTAVGFSEKKYILDSAELTNNTNEISLFLLPSSLAIEFFIKVEQNLFALADATVQVQKFFTGQGLFKTVEIQNTDDDGKFVSFLELNKEYQFIVIKDSEVLTVDQKTSLCESAPCELTIQIGTTEFDILTGTDTFAENVLYNLSYNKDTNIVTFDFVDITGLATSFRMTITQITFNQTGNVVSDQQLFTSSGTMTFNMTGESGDYRAEIFISRSPFKTIDFLDFVVNDIAGELGLIGLLFAFLLILTIIFGVALKPSMLILSVPLALIVTKYMGILSIGYTALTAITILALISFVALEK